LLTATLQFAESAPAKEPPANSSPLPPDIECVTSVEAITDISRCSERAMHEGFILLLKSLNVPRRDAALQQLHKRWEHWEDREREHGPLRVAQDQRLAFAEFLDNPNAHQAADAGRSGRESDRDAIRVAAKGVCGAPGPNQRRGCGSVLTTAAMFNRRMRKTARPVVWEP
jgi:hypothetical protein